MPRHGVQYIKNSEPSFIRRFKEQAGVPSDDTIESKKKLLTTTCSDEDNLCDRPDEQPQIVLDPSCSGMSENDAREFLARHSQNSPAGDQTKGADRKDPEPDKGEGASDSEENGKRLKFRSAGDRRTAKSKPNVSATSKAKTPEVDERERSPLRRNPETVGKQGVLSFTLCDEEECQ